MDTSSAAAGAGSSSRVGPGDFSGGSGQGSSHFTGPSRFDGKKVKFVQDPRFPLQGASVSFSCPSEAREILDVERGHVHYGLDGGIGSYLTIYYDLSSFFLSVPCYLNYWLSEIEPRGPTGRVESMIESILGRSQSELH